MNPPLAEVLQRFHPLLPQAAAPLLTYISRNTQAAALRYLRGLSTSASEYQTEPLPQYSPTPIPPPPHAKVLDGRAVAAEWVSQLKAEAELLTQQIKRPPGLSVILVGNRPDSLLYVTKKQEACQKVGIRAEITRLPEGVSQGELEGAVRRVCSDPAIDGVLIQLPLPRQLDEEAVMDVLDPMKDVDGFHPINMGRLLMRGRRARYVPCTPLGCMQLLRHSGVEVRGRRAVVVGDSNIVGTPLAVLLREEGAAAVTICHRLSYQEWFEDEAAVQSRRAAAQVCLPRLPGPNPRPPPPSIGSAPCPSTPLPHSLCFQSHQLPDLTRTADILVVAVGHAELVKREWVKPGAVVLDVGINVVAVPTSSSDSSSSSSGSGSASDRVCASGASSSGSGGSSGGSGSSSGSKCGAGSATGSASSRSSESRSHSSSSSNSSSNSDDGGSRRHSSAFNNSTCGSSSSSSGGSGGDSGSCGGVGYAGPALPASFPPAYHVVGDVHFGEVSEVASVITPVPGGVGPMTIAAVVHNTLQAARYNAGLDAW